MNEIRGDWMQTFTGGRFFPLEPHAEDVRIEDIAHALALTCRFNGHVRDLYTVAQHSYLVADLASTWAPPAQRETVALCGLLHDAAEAYVGDMVRPLKRNMSAYREAEWGIEAIMRARFGLPNDVAIWSLVKQADLVLLATERRDLFVHELPWELLEEERVVPLEETIKPWSPREAERRFLMAFDAVGGR